MLRTAFMGGLQAELQRRLTVEDEELPLKDLFTRGQYLEAAHHEGNQEASKGGGYRNQSKSNRHVYGRSTEKCYYIVINIPYIYQTDAIYCFFLFYFTSCSLFF